MYYYFIRSKHPLNPEQPILLAAAVRCCGALLWCAAVVRCCGALLPQISFANHATHLQPNGCCVLCKNTNSVGIF